MDGFDMMNAGGRGSSCGGIALAKVTSIKDPKDLGRVKCAYISADKNLGETGWIHCMTPFGGKECGFFFHPNVEDIVVLAYEDGDIHRPFVLGSLWVSKSKPPLAVKGGKNQQYRLSTPNKSFLEFGDEDKKEKITLSTPKGREVLLDDEKKLISVTDGKNKLTMKEDGGTVELTCDKKLVIKVGSGVTITCDGTSGAVEIKTNKEITLSSAQIKAKASGTAQIEGSGSVTVKSSGSMTIKGSMTSIN